MTIPMRLSRTRLVMGAAGIAAVTLFAWLLKPAHASSQHQAAPAAVEVSTAPVVARNVPIYLEGLGTVQAFYTVKMTAQVDGQLTQVAFVEGQQVKRGQLLAQIDPRPYQAALDGARAALAKDTAQLADAHKDLARYVFLEPKKLASQQQVDSQRALVAQLKAQTEADQAAIESAATQLSYTRITSPINGRTGIRLVDPGNIVHSTDTTGIVVLTQLQPITAIFTLPEDTFEAVAGAMAKGTGECHRDLPAGRRHRARPGHRQADRQPDRHDDRHHPPEGRLPQHEAQALARAIRQRAPARAHRRERPDGTGGGAAART